jgi:putative chitinase
MDAKLQPIIDAFIACDITDPYLQKAIVANMKKECGLVPKEENLNYSKTPNARIRSIFGSRVANLSEPELDLVKSNPQTFAELVYGSGNVVGRSMGNTAPGDGWKYRGRGYIQLTGKNNYKSYGDLAGFDILNNPDWLVNNPPISAIVSVLFVKKGLGSNLTFADQQSADRAVTQVIGGRGLNLDSGYGAELLAKVNKYSEEIKLV